MGVKFIPTDEQRKSVAMMTGCGIPIDDIARVLGMAHRTLMKHFREELDIGSAKLNALVAQSLFQNAIGGNVAAQIFWCKTRLGWKEIDRHEHTGADGGAIKTEDVNVTRQRILDELGDTGERLRLQRAGVAPGTGAPQDHRRPDGETIN